MDELEQQGGRNAARLRSRQKAWVILGAAWWLLAARVDLDAQSFAAELPDAPSALMLSGRVAGQRHAVAVEAQNRAPSVPESPPQNTPQPTTPDSSLPFPPATATPAAQAPSVTPPLLGQASAQVPSGQTESAKLPPCPNHAHAQHRPVIFLPATQTGCEDQLQLIVDTGYVEPLSNRQKGVLAVRSVTDPFNFLTIAAFSGFSVAANAHSVYGPGLAGWGRLTGYSLAEDIQGTFTEVYLIPVLAHEDPRYHRMPHASIRRRMEHALIHTFVSQHDDGSLMPNYATLINYPLSAEISNLYVPGIGTNGSATAKRVLVGYATDPVGPLVAEFLPDVARRIHIHIVFAQQILNAIALGSGAQSSSY